MLRRLIDQATLLEALPRADSARFVFPADRARFVAEP